ncbi:MAG: rhomboid family intramembrane serine protease [Bacteroidales bacterium]|nr:rhomboid family intramembrane serine protease [Bacteroidales bacterium]MBN2750029.1 rhomboid family intramembrane serine protease [Bacteroidales bacterium]
MDSFEKKKFKLSLAIPLLLVLFLWLIALVDSVAELEFYRGGVYPRRATGLMGIVLAPLLHSGFKHLFANTLPILILGTAINYFYRALAYKILILVWLLTGVLVWIFGRESYHVGASGIIYGVASFLFFSGVIRGNIHLAALSLIVVFLYGGLVWGIFPFSTGVSWESHFFGGFWGLVTAICFRNQGPITRHNFWVNSFADEEDEDDDDGDNPYWADDSSLKSNETDPKQ